MHSKIFLFLIVAPFVFMDSIHAQSAATGGSPEYRAWVYRFECGDLKSRGGGDIEFMMSSSFFAVDTYAELEKRGYKHVKALLRAESLTQVDETKRRLAWVKANKGSYTNDSQMVSAMRRAVPSQSVSQYLQKQGKFDFYRTCECYNLEKSKNVKSEADFKSKTEKDLGLIEVQAKAVCITANFKP